MATITERTAKDGSVSFKAEVRLKGFPAQRATFKRKTDAKRWVQDTESAIRDGRYFKSAEAKKHSVADLVTRYCDVFLPNNSDRVYSVKEQAERRHRLDFWVVHLGCLSLADLSPQLIVEKLELLPVANATKAKYLKNFSHALSVGVRKWGWLEANPALKVSSPCLPKGRVRFLEDDERARLLVECQNSNSPFLYTAVVLALSTGMRQGELMGLQWQDVNLKEGFLILHQTKNGERRRVPLASLALELLRQHGKVRCLVSPLVFPSARNPLKPVCLRSAFDYALDRAGIVDFHWHDLRHCTASYLAMNGASLAEIAEVLGHKTLAMVKRYAHLSDSHVAGVVASMNNKIFGGVG